MCGYNNPFLKYFIMPKKSVLGHPDNVPSLAREGFSLDQVFTFTASTGMLLPVWQDFLNPGETLKGAPNFLLRSDAFLSPAMADIDCFCELFFVPMQKIFSSFGEWLYQIDDIRSDFVDLDNFTEYLPILKSYTNSKNPFSGLTKECFDQPLYPDTTPGAFSYHRFDSFGFGLYRLMFHFGFNPQSIFYGLYNTYSWQDEETNQAILAEYQDFCYDLDEANFCPYMFAAYQGIYYDIYRNSEFEHNNILAYNMDSIFNDGVGIIDADNIFDGSSSSQGRRAMFDLRYRWRGKDYFTATRSTPLINSISMMPHATEYLKKVNQWLTSGSYGIYDSANINSGGDYGYNAFTNFGVDLRSGEIDAYLIGSADIDLTGMSVGLQQYYKTTSGNSFASDAGASFSPDQNDLSRGYFITSDSLGNRPSLRHDHSLSGTATADLSEISANIRENVSSVLTTARLRTMFALEKMSRITQRAGKHYDDQTLAHFGFKINKGLSGEVYKIGSWHTTLGIQKVTSTAATDDAPLGEQAGVGYAVLDGSKKKFKFTAPCHGIVMCIWSCAPRYKYIFTRDKLNYKTKLWDFFKPSLDNLGSQPLFSYEFPVKSTGSGLQTGVAGWQWRFMESKVKFNRVSPVFATVSKNPWSMTALPFTYQDCGFVSPMDLNLLINTQYNPSPSWPESGQQQDHKTWFGDFPREFLRDPFTIDFYMDCTKVSTMSTFGDTPLNGI